MYGFSYEVPGDEHIYERVKAEIAEERPDGLILQVVDKVEFGVRHMFVWDSKETWGRFQRERVAPAVTKVLEGMGIQGELPPPVITELDLVDVITR